MRLYRTYTAASKLGIQTAYVIMGVMLLLAFGIVWFIPQPSISSSELYLPPFSEGYLFGSDGLGRSVFAYLIHGLKTALIVGLGSMFLAFVIGTSIGLLAGYFGNDRLYISKRNSWFLIILAPLLIYLSAWMFFYSKIHFCILLLIFFIFKIYFLGFNRTKSFSFPIDLMSMRIVDFVRALPALMILLLLVKIINQNSYLTIIFSIAFFSWPTFARYARAETIKWRSATFIQNIQLKGKHPIRLIFLDILPLILRPLFVVFCFGVSSAIIVEASLSFLGMGLPSEYFSWGSMMVAAKSNLSAWWLWFFPGLFLFLLTWSLHQFAQYFERRAGANNRLIEVK